MLPAIHRDHLPADRRGVEEIPKRASDIGGVRAAFENRVRALMGEGLVALVRTLKRGAGADAVHADARGKGAGGGLLLNMGAGLAAPILPGRTTANGRSCGSRNPLRNDVLSRSGSGWPTTVNQWISLPRKGRKDAIIPNRHSCGSRNPEKFQG